MAPAKKPAAAKPKVENAATVEPTPEVEAPQAPVVADDAPVTPDEVQPPQEPVEVQQEEPVPAPPNVYGSPYGRRVQAKAVLYTDGISGEADHNHERAYEYSEKLQSNDPQQRSAGDVSLSEAAQERRSDRDKREAEDVASGSRLQ